MVAEKEGKYNSSLFAAVSCIVVSVVLGVSSQEGAIRQLCCGRTKIRISSTTTTTVSTGRRRCLNCLNGPPTGWSPQVCAHLLT